MISSNESQAKPKSGVAGTLPDRVWDLIVVGGGPAGLMSALLSADSLARRGGAVLLLEKKPQPGRKLLLTGSGRCNISNAGVPGEGESARERGPATVREARAMAAHYAEFPVEPDGVATTAARGVLQLLSRFPPALVKQILGPDGVLGIQMVEQEQGRLFPASDSAREVLDALLDGLARRNVTVRTGVRVVGLNQASGPEGQAQSIDSVVIDDGSVIRGRRFVLATGGANYPATGSTADSGPWLKRLGLRTIDVWPALVGIKVGEAWSKRLAGLGLERVGLSLWLEGGGQIGKPSFGPLIFTHGGLSGPLILHRSAMIIHLQKQLAPPARLILRLDLVPDASPESISSSLDGMAKDYPHRQLGTFLSGYLSQTGAELLCKNVAGLDPAHKLGQLPRSARKAIVSALKALDFHYAGHDGWDKAISTAGGLVPGELDWSDMSCKRFPNLHVIGDAVSLERQSGGYSLLLCWAMALAVSNGID